MDWTPGLDGTSRSASCWLIPGRLRNAGAAVADHVLASKIFRVDCVFRTVVEFFSALKAKLLPSFCGHGGGQTHARVGAASKSRGVSCTWGGWEGG